MPSANVGVDPELTVEQRKYCDDQEMECSVLLNLKIAFPMVCMVTTKLLKALGHGTLGDVLLSVKPLTVKARSWFCLSSMFA